MTEKQEEKIDKMYVVVMAILYRVGLYPKWERGAAVLFLLLFFCRDISGLLSSIRALWNNHKPVGW